MQPLRYLTFLLIFCCSANIYAHESTIHSTKETSSKIIWLIEDTFEWQDYINEVSRSTSQDTATIVLHGLEELGYNLTFTKATGDRAEKILQDEENACISNRIKTPKRERFSLFSMPHDLYLGLQLYRVAQSNSLNKNVLNAKGEVISLAQLFSFYPEKIMAVGSGVSYGEYIDKQVTALSHDNVFVRSGGSRIASIANMLLKNRVDYIIYNPQDINNINQGNISLESYTIAGSLLIFLAVLTVQKPL